MRRSPVFVDDTRRRPPPRRALWRRARAAQGSPSSSANEWATRLAVECDGDEFHGPDRWPADMQRQRILERAGWVFWRCFASTWSLHKVDVLADLRARLHAMGIEPLGALERTPLVVESRIWPPVSVPDEASGSDANDAADDHRDA